MQHVEIRPIVGSITPVEREYRTPRVLIDVEMGPITLQMTLICRQGGKFVMHMPQTLEGKPGITLTPELKQAVGDAVNAALKANPQAWRDLRAQRRRARKAERTEGAISF